MGEHGSDNMKKENLISGRQIRMARAALRWRVDDLSKNSGVSWARIQMIERNNDIQVGLDEKLINIKKVFELNGIVFKDKNRIYKEYIIIKSNID